MSSVVEEIRTEVEEEIRAEVEGEALARGLAQGRAEGMREANVATVRQLLKMGGFSLESIAEITRLSIEEVRAIAEREAR